MREKDFERQVKAFLADEGCWFVKTFSNGVQRAGIPDIIACINGYFIGIELKAETGRPSELQLWNIEKIRDAHGIAMVLYPHQFAMFKDMVRELKKGNHKDTYIAQRIFTEKG